VPDKKSELTYPIRQISMSPDQAPSRSAVASFALGRRLNCRPTRGNRPMAAEESAMIVRVDSRQQGEKSCERPARRVLATSGARRRAGSVGLALLLPALPFRSWQTSPPA
jgi:hypothetical protein